HRRERDPPGSRRLPRAGDRGRPAGGSGAAAGGGGLRPCPVAARRRRPSPGRAGALVRRRRTFRPVTIPASRHTRLLRVDATRPGGAAIAEAAAVLRAGGLVAFPTETVYGLG